MANTADTGEVKIELLDSKTLDKVEWKNIEKVTAKVGELCRAAEPCPQTITANQTTLTLPTETLVRIDLEVTYPNLPPVALAPVITRIRCNEQNPPTISVLIPPPTPATASTESATVLVQGHLCSHKEGKRDRIRPVGIETPTVTVVWYLDNQGKPKQLDPKQPDPNAPSPKVITMQGGIALLTLPVKAMYEITVQSKEKCGRSCPSMPIQMPVWYPFEQSWEICFEPAEPAAALFFVDSCDQPVAPTDVFRQGYGKPLEIGSRGHAWVTGKGPVKLSSATHELFPDEIPIRERPEPHVVRALPRAGAGKPHTSGHHECTFAFEGLRRGSRATVKVMKQDGQLIKTLEANEQGEVIYKPDDPNEVLKYVGCIDGVEHETVLMKAI
jgi:hypothetical protein